MRKSFEFLKVHVVEQITSDVLTGGNQKKKILPECKTPDVEFDYEPAATDEQKIAVILSDPRFGMLSLFKYHVINSSCATEVFEKSNTVFCAHIFSLCLALPVWIYVIQWLLLTALITHESRMYSKGWCPNSSPPEHKMVMIGVSLLYFVKSFFLFDNFADRTRTKKLMPVKDLWVILDTLQEFGFALATYIVNLWVIFMEKDIQNMLMNCLAIEFLMLLDNEFEEIYFKFLPSIATDLYDKVFVTYEENLKIVDDSMQNSECFRCSRALTYLPLKLLQLSLLLFPPACLATVIFGAICK